MDIKKWNELPGSRAVEGWPYTNLHDLNLDWIINTTKEFAAEISRFEDNVTEEVSGFEERVNVKIGEFEGTIQEYTDKIDVAIATVDEKIEYIDNFFSSLDVQQEINNKLDSMAGDGTLAALLKPFADAWLAQDAPGVISAWLAANITEPVGVVIDSSLSVSGAAADAAVVGQNISDLKNAICPLFVSSRGNRTAVFRISSVAGNTENTFIYTIEAIHGATIYAISEREVGTKYSMYTLRYIEGSNNIGTSANNYIYGKYITSEETSEFAAFVCDRSDYSMKIIPAHSLNENTRVIAIFYGRDGQLINGFTGFGTNEGLFDNVGDRIYNKIYITNMSSSSWGALTWEKGADNRYTITQNKQFVAFGIDEQRSRQIGIGTAGIDGVTYPFPATLVSTETIPLYGVLVCNRENTTESTWEIITLSTLNMNMNKYLVLGFLYKNYAQFFTEEAEMLFTNFVEGDTYKIWETAREAFYYGKIGNIITLASGTVDYNVSAHTVTITNPITAPEDTPGKFNAEKVNETIVLDFSADEHPNYLKSIYWDNVIGDFVVISDDTPAEESRAYRNRKNSLALLCMVFGARYVYTSSCQKGVWKLNGRDYYADSTASVPDLYKTFKKVGVVGDSLSVGYMVNKTTGVVTSRMLQYSWPKKVMSDAGGVPWLNLGTSGQNVLTWCSNATYGKVQAEANGNKCQAYIIGLGENDQSETDRGVPLGNPSDIVNNYQTVATTYYGGYARIIQILQHLNPNCKIFCLTNPRTGANRAEYNEAVRYIAGTYYTPNNNVFLVDLANDDAALFNGSAFLPADSAAITGGHYSAIGYTRIATIMEQAITDAIERYQTHFVDIPYIPYDTNDPTPNTMTE